MFLLIVVGFLVMIALCFCVLIIVLIVLMNKILTIRVVCQILLILDKKKKLYRNNVEVDDSLDIPFGNLIESFKFLYKKVGVKVVFGYEL